MDGSGIYVWSLLYIAGNLNELVLALQSPDTFQVVDFARLTNASLLFISLDILFSSLYLLSKVEILPVEDGAARSPSGASGPPKPNKDSAAPSKAPSRGMERLRGEVAGVIARSRAGLEKRYKDEAIRGQ